MAKRMQYLVNGIETTYAVRSAQPCDYCGEPGCHWQRHSEARADMAAWDRAVQQENFPFGDHVEY